MKKQSYLLTMLISISLAGCTESFEFIPDGFNLESYVRALNLSTEAAKKFINDNDLAEKKLNQALINKIATAEFKLVKYAPDKEHTIKTAQQTLHDGEGDCEDQAILNTAILKELGVKTTIFRRKEIAEGEPGHVFAAYAVDGKSKNKYTLKNCGISWNAMDTSFGEAAFIKTQGLRENFSGKQYTCFIDKNGCCVQF